MQSQDYNYRDWTSVSAPEGYLAQNGINWLTVGKAFKLLNHYSFLFEKYKKNLIVGPKITSTPIILIDSLIMNAYLIFHFS